MRSRSPDLRTVPSSTTEVPSSAPTARTSSDFAFNAKADVRDETRSPEIFARASISSSVMPSLKYSFSGSGLALMNGSTAIDRVTAGRRFAREHLVQDAREAVDVAGGTQLRVAARLLGTHVLRCAHGEADLGHRVPANPAGFGVRARARHTEICEDRVPIGEQNVLGFDIAMDEPFAMREIEASPDFLCDTQRVLQRQLPGRVQPLAERAAGHMRLHVVEPPRGFAGVDQGND